MRKNILTCLCLWVAIAQAFPQSTFDNLLKKGKAEFKKEPAQQDYAVAVDALEKAALLKPENVEVHYFFGYAYDRLGSKDGSGILQNQAAFSLKASKEFETVIRLTPKYEGEMVLLDPYSKLSSIWGSLAMQYYHKEQTDSLRWALNEGRKRGGFGDFYLYLARVTLDACAKNALLFSSGDNLTFSLLYMQQFERYRADVAVIDASLLEATWYPAAIQKKKLVAFDIPAATLDTMNYCAWSKKTVEIPIANTQEVFKWELRGEYRQYLSRSDRLLYNILQVNQFKRGVYFTPAFPKDNMLNLSMHTRLVGVGKEVNVQNSTVVAYAKDTEWFKKILLIATKFNPNSQDEHVFLDHIRVSLLGEQVLSYHYKKMKTEAQALYQLIESTMPEAKYPFFDHNSRDYLQYIRKTVQE